MKKIRIERQHNLDEEGCRELVVNLSEKLASRLGGTTSHGAQKTLYQHPSGAKGVLSFDSNVLIVEVSVPFLMRPLAATIESEIHRQCDKHLK